MHRVVLLALLAVVFLPPAARAQSPTVPDARYAELRAELEAARAQGTLRATAARLARDPRVQGHNAARLFARGIAAMLVFNRSSAERDLARSFALSSAPSVALAITANAIEVGDADAVLAWAARGLAAAGESSAPGVRVELRLARAQGLVWERRYEEQRAEVSEALEEARRLEDGRLIALALRARGVILGELAQPEVIDTFEEAARLSAGDPRAMGYHLLLLNTYYYPHRPFAGKIALLDRVVALARQVADRQLEGRALGARGAALTVVARYGEALTDLTASDALLRQTGADRSRASVAGNLGLLFIEIGDYDRAEQQARLATSLYQRVRNFPGVRLSLDDLGRIALLQGRSALAVRRHERALALTREIGDPGYIRPALTHLGLAYAAQRDWRRAEQVLDEALRIDTIALEPDDQRESARVALGDVLRVTGRHVEAERAYRHTIAVAPRLAHAAGLLVRAHHGLGLLEAQAGHFDAALDHYRAALARIEEARAGAGAAELQLTYFADKTALYVDAIDALVEAHRKSGDAARLAEAFQLSELSKARTVVDALAARAGDHDGVASAAEAAATLEPTDFMVAFVAGARRSFAFTLDSTGALAVHVLPARAVLEAEVRAVRREVTARPKGAGAITSAQRAGARAFATLLAPVLAAVSGRTRLIVVADAGLFYAPFEALIVPTTRRYLGEDFEVVRAASASVLARQRSARARAAATSFVAFGDPHVGGDMPDDTALVRALERDGFTFAPLPGSRREVQDAAAALQAPDTRIYTGASFTAAAVLAELQRPNRIVHFATHAILDERVPQRSGIVTSPPAAGGVPPILRVRDLAGLEIPVDLVVLSACQTGLGALLSGEGVLGLTWAFTRAGVSSLIVTLWNISDAASGQAMVAFYRALARGGTKSAALRAARREMIANVNPLLRHPYYWAGYTLIGDPR